MTTESHLPNTTAAAVNQGISAEVASEIQENLRSVYQRINTSCQPMADSTPPRLVAVSKLKSTSLIRACYDAGQRVFGENYVQELIDKSQSEEIRKFCPEIKWHFIGTLQTNKAAKLCTSVPNLVCVETVSSEKHARALNSAWARAHDGSKLAVFIQVNTSGEEQKSGVELEAALDLADFIMDRCDQLKFRGFMTIGALARSMQSSEEENADFVCLAETRRAFCSRRGLRGEIELSMGMSNDFEQAIRMGSSNVRIGSTIFGARS